MRRSLTLLLTSAVALSLSACASVPSQTQLMSGIDKTQLTQTAAKTRSATDPVCVDFYNNVVEYQKKAQASKGSQNFLARLGLNVAAALLTQQIIPTGIASETGRIATQVAAGSAVSQGTNIALRELNSTNRADAKIIEVASEIGCPVNIAP